MKHTSTKNNISSLNLFVNSVLSFAFMASSFLYVSNMIFYPVCVYASKKENKVETQPESVNNQILDMKLIRFSNIAGNSSQIIVLAENAQVFIKRIPGTGDIILKSSCPSNWSVSKDTIRQCGFSGQSKKGSSFLSDALGARAIVNGKVYMFPPGPMKGINMGAEGVFINGQKIEPLKGIDMPGSCADVDILEVSVPETFSGDLKLGGAGKSMLSLEAWKGGTVEGVLTGESSISAGKLDSLSKAAFDIRGKGTVDLKELKAKIFVANVNGSGSVNVKKGNTEISNATVSGEGKILLHGSFKNMQKAVDGNGNIEVSP